MSLGFKRDVKIIQEAIIEAEKRRKTRVLFFAAANNSGKNESERFPASSEAVISVRGTDHMGEVEGSVGGGIGRYWLNQDRRMVS
jgi:hypothetical protein